MTREERRARREKIKERLKTRARQAHKVVEAEEDAREYSVASRIIQKLNNAELKRLNEHVKSSIQTASASPEEAGKMLVSFKEKQHLARNHLANQHKEQIAKIKERLAKARENRCHGVLEATSNAVDMSKLDVPELELAPEHIMEQDAMEKNQLRMEEELRSRHEQERVELERKLEQEAAEEEMRALEALEDRKQQLLKETRAKLETEVRSRQDLTEEEMNRLLKEHEEQLGTLSKRMDAERTRQHELVKAKLNDRKKKRKQVQQQRQEVELQRELAVQRQETHALKHEQVRDAEKDAMVISLQQSGQDVETVVAAVLQRRHAQELQDIRESVEGEQETTLKELKASIHEKHGSRVEERMQRHEKEMADFIIEFANVDPAQAEEVRRDIETQYKLDLAELENEYENELEQSEMAAQARLELKLTEMLLKLKEQHYQEFAEALRDLSPNSEESTVAEQRACELERLREQLEQKRREQFQELEEQQQTMLKQLLDEHQRVLLQEEQEERERMNTEIAELNAVREKIKEESKMQIKKQYEQLAQLTDEDGSAVLEKFNKSQAHLSQLLDAEKQRQKAILMARRSQQLHRKRQKQRQCTNLSDGDISGESITSNDDTRVQSSASFERPTNEVRLGERCEEQESTSSTNVLDIAECDVEKMNEIVDDVIPLKVSADDYTNPLQDRNVEDSNEEVLTISTTPKKQYSSSDAITSERLRDSTTSTNVFVRLEAIERMLRQCRSKTFEPAVDEIGQGMDLEGETPLLLDLEELDAMELLSLEVGIALCTWLAKKHQYPLVQLVPASKLPAVSKELNNDYIGNVYRRSVLYLSESLQLVVRREYLQSIDKLLPLLLHSISHIAVGNMHSDDHPDFLASFHRTIGVVGQLLLSAKVDVGKAVKKIESTKAASRKDAARKFLDQIML